MEPELVDRYSDTWERRASVKRFRLPSFTQYDPALPDFPVELLPFARHGAFEAADPSMQSNVISCGWLSYNATTIDIERHILAPATLLIFDRMSDVSARSVITQTMTDESYHLVITEHASNLTRRARGLEQLTIPTSNIVTNMRAFQAEQPDQWRRDLVLVCTTIVTEMLICNHLRRIASAVDIQPINAATTRAHLLDEQAHSGIFRAIAHRIWADLSPSERAFFVTASLEPLAWFANHEHEAWDSMFAQIGFREGDALVGDCLRKADHLDNRAVIDFLRDLGATSLPEPSSPLASTACGIALRLRDISRKPRKP